MFQQKLCGSVLHSSKKAAQLVAHSAQHLRCSLLLCGRICLWLFFRTYKRCG